MKNNVKTKIFVIKSFIYELFEINNNVRIIVTNSLDGKKLKNTIYQNNTINNVLIKLNLENFI
jgi:hypothetical protein